MRCLTGPDLPFLNRAGPCLVQHVGRLFSDAKKRRKTPEHETQKKTNPNEKPTPTYDFRIPTAKKRGTSLFRKLFTPLGWLGRNTPCVARWPGRRVLSAGQGPRATEGTLSPRRSPAASPSYKTFGWVPEGKIRCYLSQQEDVWGARYRLRIAQSGALDTTHVQCQCRSGPRRLRRPAL